MRVIPLEMESVQGRDLTTWGHGEHELVEVHGVGPLDAVVADVALLIGDIVEDERSHGWERVFNDKGQWRTGEELMRAHKSRSLRMGVDAERRGGQGQGRALMGTESELELELEMQMEISWELRKSGSWTSAWEPVICCAGLGCSGRATRSQIWANYSVPR